MRQYVLLALFICIALPTQAKEPRRMIAILPSETDPTVIDDTTRLEFEEAIRKVTIQQVPSDAYNVLSGPETLKRLSEAGVDLTKGHDSEWAWTSAPRMQAWYYLHADLGLKDGVYRAKVVLNASMAGVKLTGARLEGKSVKELVAKFEEQAPRVFKGPVTRARDWDYANNPPVMANLPKDAKDTPGANKELIRTALETGNMNPAKPPAKPEAKAADEDPNHILGPGSIGTSLDAALGGMNKDPTPTPPRAKFIPGRIKVTGGLSADEVTRIIRQRWNEIRTCYEKELPKSPNLAGKVSVDFEITATGEVKQALVKETDLHNNDVEACMLTSIRTWKFPTPRDGGVAAVKYPFIFQAPQ